MIPGAAITYLVIYQFRRKLGIYNELLNSKETNHVTTFQTYYVGLRKLLCIV